MNATPILVVDDERKILEVVKSYLEREGYAVLCACGGRQALELFELARPALVILDLMLPDISGETLFGMLRERSDVPVIMLTARAEDAHIVGGLRLGADDYVTKPFSPGQLVARVGAVLRRASGAEETKGLLSLDGGRLVIDDGGREVMKDAQPVALTPNEYGILHTLANRPGRVFTRDELISSAFGDDYEGFGRAVDTHVKNLRQKIEDDPKAPRYILTVYGVGYKFGGGCDGG